METEARIFLSVSQLWTSPTRSYNRPLHLPLLKMPAAEMKRQRDGNLSPQKSNCLESLLRKSAVVVEALGTPAQNPRGGEVEAAIRQLVGRGGGRRLRSARLCSPAARTVGGKKGELQLVEMRLVEKSYIIGGRRLWSAGPCSPATRRPGGDRKNQSADLFGPNIRMTGGDRRLQLLELCSPVTDKILQMNT